MSESPPPVVTVDAAVHPAEALTPERVEAVLADFRAWLSRAASAPAGPPPAPAPATVDLHTLLGQFVALRHEVNLRTKAARAQQEQNGEALRWLGQAVDALERVEEEPPPNAADAQEAVLRPLLKTLADTADALELARRKMLQAREGLWPLLEQIRTPPASAAEHGTRGADSWWGKWFGGRRPEATAAPPSSPVSSGNEVAGQVRQLVESLIEGYTMSLQRVERALEQHGLERIDCAGQPFDPERMEVMDVAHATGRPPGEVVEEVRRGYLWRGRVFRCALVRVARP